MAAESQSEPLVLVPGLACTARLFEAQIAALGRSRDVMVADHASDDTMATIAARLLAAAPQRFALAGLSMGGYIAFEVLRQAPARVARLALLDTNARADGEEARRNRMRLVALAEGGRLGEVHEALWPRLVHPDRQGDAALARTITGMMEETGADAFVRQQRAIMGRRDSRPGLASIAVPTLILVGEQDVLTPPEQAEEMAGLIRDAVLVRVSDCGHLSALERPEAVSRALQRWLES